MKIHTCIGLVACCYIGLAQENPSSTTANEPPASPPAVEQAPAPAAPAESTGPPASPPAAEPAAAPAAPAESAGPPTSPAEDAQAAGVIPLIQYVDVPLTTAIENLARQAGVNYILDYKVPYGQVGPDGKPQPQPTLSIRWENLTAEQALTAVLNNYDLQLVADPKTKIARITKKDPAAPPPLMTKIIQLKYSSASNMAAAVQAVFVDKRSKVLPDSRTSQIVVTTTESELDAVNEMVEKLDMPTRQVLIEARLIEISRSPSTVKGIDWADTLRAQSFRFGNNALQGLPAQPLIPGDSSTTPPTPAVPAAQGTIGGIVGDPKVLVDTASGFNPAIGFLNANGVEAVLSFLNEDADTHVISTPRAVTLDNETAILSVTRGYPIFKNTAGTQGSPGGSEVTYTNLGTILTVTPRISANDCIWLKVVPEVSSVFSTARKVVAGTINEADIYDFRRIETQVLIPSANTLVMGGLMNDSTRNNYRKVPLLGDLPILGLAFRYESKALEKRNLLIFITPTIVKDSDFRPTETDFLQSEPDELKTTINGDSLWEGARPHDWSKPRAKRSKEAAFDHTAADKVSMETAPQFSSKP